MKTPEQTLSDLLALGEKAVQFTDDRCIELGLATKNAIPALRSLMEEVKGLREAAQGYLTAEDADHDPENYESLLKYECNKADAEMKLHLALSRLGGK